MRKFLILAVAVGAAVFTAVSLANDGSGSTIPQVPGEMKTLDAHRMTTGLGKALGAKASAKHSRFKLLYFFHDVHVPPGETRGGKISCRKKKWHPVSGLFEPDRGGVVPAFDGPVSKRKWGIFVFNEGSTEATVLIGAVCEKGLPIPPPPS
jgi:hypothetical protein